MGRRGGSLLSFGCHQTRSAYVGKKSYPKKTSRRNRQTTPIEKIGLDELDIKWKGFAKTRKRYTEGVPVAGYRSVGKRARGTDAREWGTFEGKLNDNNGKYERVEGGGNSVCTVTRGKDFPFSVVRCQEGGIGDL